MAALQELDNQLCPGGCGQPLHESSEAGAISDYRGKVLVCHACKAGDKAREKSATAGMVYVERVWDNRTNMPLVDDLDEGDFF